MSQVADRVVSAILRDKQRVLMPFSVKFMPLLRMLPVPVFDTIASFLGVNASMDEFVGRHASEPPTAGEADDAWGVSFVLGTTTRLFPKSSPIRTRAVRGGL